jgi:hypothetical protein
MFPKIAILYCDYIQEFNYKNHFDNLFSLNDCDIFVYTNRYYSCSQYNKLPKNIDKNIFNEIPKLKHLEFFEDNLNDMLEFRNLLKTKDLKLFSKENLELVFKQNKLYNKMLDYQTKNNITYDIIILQSPNVVLENKIIFTKTTFSINEKIEQINDNLLYGLEKYFVFGYNELIEKYLRISHKCYPYLIKFQQLEGIKYENIYFEDSPRCAILMIGHFTEVSKYTSKIQMEQFIKPNNCDIFIYTSKKSKYRGKDIKTNNPIISKEEIYDLYDNYENIKEIKFEEDDNDNYECNLFLSNALLNYGKNNIHQDGTRRPNYSETLPQWFKLMKCYEMVKNYEKENGFKYNIVVKCRPDINMPKNIDLNQVIGSFLKNDNLKYTLYGWCDVMYMGSPENINWISQLIKYYYTYIDKDTNLRYDSCRWFFAHENQFACHHRFFLCNYINKLRSIYGIEIERDVNKFITN